MDGIYYLVGEDSPAMLVVREHEGAYEEFLKAIEGFKQKHGAAGIYTYGRRGFAGLRFEGDPPKGWRVRKDGVSVADTRNKVGKSIKKEIDSLPTGHDPWNFSVDLGEGYSHWADGRVYFSTCLGKYRDKYVLRVPVSCKVVPEGCEELKVSEVQRMIEEAKEKKQETGK